MSQADPGGSAAARQPGRIPGKAWLLAIAAAVIMGVALAGLGGPQPAETIPLSQAVAMVQDGKVATASVQQDRRIVTLEGTNGTEYQAAYPAGYEKDLSSLLLSKDIEVTATPVSPPSAAGTLLLAILPVVLIVAFLLWLSRKGTSGLLGIGGKFGGRTTPADIPDTRFSDVAGLDEAVADVGEIVEFLDNPDKFQRTGARIPRGVLLVGPPGSGKTLLARAVAGESKVPFFAMSGADFVEVFAGLGASRVRQLFAKAREAGKAIVFIDEIDAIGRKRGSGPVTGANDEREGTLNQLLVELDGFAQSNVIIMAASNRPDVLDPALVRPGRFDRSIIIPAPDRAGREQILRLHATGKPFQDGIAWDSLARRTQGMSGADLENLINEAALGAARQGNDTIGMRDLEDALQTARLGRERRSSVISERDAGIVAWHEAGHALAALLIPDAPDPVMVSVVPRGPAGGATWMEGPEHDLMTRAQARAQLTVALAGRAGEELLLDGQYTQGSSGDLQASTELATRMVTRWGMGSSLASREAPVISAGQDPVLDEVDTMLRSALDDARTLLGDNQDLLHAIAQALQERETIALEDLRQIHDSMREHRLPSPPGTPAGSSSSQVQRQSEAHLP